MAGAPSWTPAEDALLRRLRAEGQPFKVCAVEIGRSETACQYRAKALLGGPQERHGSKWSEAESARVLAGLREGEPIETIAAALGRTVKSVERFAYRQGWRKGRARTPRELGEIVAKHAARWQQTTPPADPAAPSTAQRWLDAVPMREHGRFTAAYLVGIWSQAMARVAARVAS